MMDTGTQAVLKLPEWPVFTDGWGLMPPHNDVSAIFKVTSFTVEPLQDPEGERYTTKTRNIAMYICLISSENMSLHLI